MAVETSEGLYRLNSPADLGNAGNRVREIPAEVAAGIIDDAITTSAALGLGNVQRMGTREQLFTLVDTLPEAYWIKGTAATDKPGFAPHNALTDGSRAAKDVALKQTTGMNYRQKKIEAEELAVMTVLPDTWRDDSGVNFAEIRPYLVEAIAKKIDAAIFFGEDLPNSWSANGFNGILPDAIAANNTLNGADAAYQNIADAVAALAELQASEGYVPRGFLAHPGFKWKVVRARDGDGNMIYSPATSAGAPESLYGLPLAELDNGAGMGHEDDFQLITGDWSLLRIGIRQDLQWAISNAAPIVNQDGTIAYNPFQQDGQVMRVTFRLAAGVVNPKKRLGGDYPFYALRPDSNYSS